MTRDNPAPHPPTGAHFRGDAKRGRKSMKSLTAAAKPALKRRSPRDRRRLTPRLPEIGLQRGRLLLEQRPDDFGCALACPEHDLAWQVEGRVLLVRPGLRFQPLLALAVDDPADSRPIDRAGAHRAGLGRSVKG